MTQGEVCCPRCSQTLIGRSLPAGSGWACSSCGGIWLDNSAATRITEALCSDTLAHADAAARAAAPVDTGATLACPTCRDTLERTSIGQARVELDFCSNHGTWFDRGELGRVAQVYAVNRAYGNPKGSKKLHGSALAGGAVLGVGAVAATQSDAIQRQVQQTGLDAETVADVAIEGGSAALDVGSAIGDTVDVGEVAGGAFEIIGALFEGLG